MKKLLLFAFALTLSIVSFSQTTITGNVKDSASGDPLPGVNVKVVGKSLGAATDFDGNYKLVVNQEAPFDLEFTAIGFKSQTQSVSSATKTIDVSLVENATSLDEVVVSASRTPERLRESPVTVERMGIREIQNSASPNFYNSLENLKGVDINTSSLTFNSVNTRGFATYSNTRFVQLVDGMDNASPALNFVVGNLLGVNELDIAGVELLPGASSALYGANAFNGILFMTSKNPFDHQGISSYFKTGITSAEVAGDNNFYDFGVRAAHAFSEKFAAKASFSYLEGTDWQANDTNNYQDVGAGNPDVITGPGAPDHDALNIYGDEVTASAVLDSADPTNLLPSHDLNGFATYMIGNGLLPASLAPLLAYIPNQDIAMSGYREADLTDYKAKSAKFDAALHFKPFENDLEIVWNSRIGFGNTIYQGTDRYQLKDFLMQQHKIEVRNKNFFVRGYTTAETAGNSYDMNFTGINLSKLTAENWFGAYTGAYAQGVATTVGGGGDPTLPAVQAQLHATARAYADANARLQPGTAAFDSALSTIINDSDVNTGSKFTDNTKMNVAEGNYNFKSLINDFMDLQVGGSYRKYALNSGGSIFTDANGPIKYDEYGAYIQGSKKFADDRLKITASARYDKSQNFDANISPRVSFNYAAGDSKQHNFRASYQTGFRNPTTQDQYIGLNVGPIILVGSAPDNLNADLPGTTLTGQDAYNNAYTLTSVYAFQASGNPADLEAVKTDVVAPEKVTAFDVGYRGKVGKVSLDINAYYNMYDGFISNTRVVSPDGGSVADITGVLALASGNSQAFQLYTNSNADINSYGAVFGLNTKIGGDYRIGVSYTYAKLDFDQASDPDFRAGFNTPENKVKFSIGNPKLFKNFGFNVNARWQDEFLWEATAASGMIDSRTIVDAQINYTMPKWKSVFKLGGANLTGDEYVSSIGGGVVGSQYFISWTINP